VYVCPFVINFKKVQKNNETFSVIKHKNDNANSYGDVAGQKN
jgi:hypothetical protein